MKISIGSEIIEGPYGGGNEYLKNLSNFLKGKGHTVVHTLKDRDIDIILLTAPFINSDTSSFSSCHVDYYQKYINSEAISFHRINECDERKGTNRINKIIAQSNQNIDITFYVSRWLKDLYVNFGHTSNIAHLIKGGPTRQIFNTTGKSYWDGKEKLSLVTHHWSSNYMKGFEEYLLLDKFLSDDIFSKKVSFTYIGNLPKNIEMPNTKIIPPLHGKDLAEELKKHHIYITGSKNEPSGNHHMEGAMCGLPVLYVKSGALVEYCKDFGVEFSKNSIKEKIELISSEYTFLTEKLNEYPYDFESSATEILHVFEEAYKSKSVYSANRKNINKFKILNTLLMFETRKYLYNLYVQVRKKISKIKKFL